MLVCFYNKSVENYTGSFKHDPCCLYNTDTFTCEEMRATGLRRLYKDGIRFFNAFRVEPRGCFKLEVPGDFTSSNDEIFIHVTQKENKRGIVYQNALYIVNREFYTNVPLFRGVSKISGGDGELHLVGMLTPPEYINGGIYCREYTIKSGRLVFKDFISYTDKKFFTHEKNFLSTYHRSILF